MKLPRATLLIRVQALLFLRDPLSVFFTLLFAPAFLVMLEVAAPVSGAADLGIHVPGYAAIVIGVVGLVGVAIEVSTRREAGVLRRFWATPLRPLIYIISDVVVSFAMITLGILLLFLLAGIVYGAQPVGSLAALALGVFLGAAAFLALGYLLASLAPSARAATVMGNVLIFPMLGLSGATVPQEIMSETMRSLARFIPLTHVVTLLQGLWSGEPMSEHLTEVAVLTAICVVATAAAARMFRWE
ncbi:MAG: ABC transporter permease [Bacillota bacterium]